MIIDYLKLKRKLLRVINNILSKIKEHRFIINLIVLSLLYFVNIFWQGIVYVIALYLLAITLLESELNGMYYLSYSVAFVCLFRAGANIYLLLPIGAIYMIKTLVKNFVIEHKPINKLLIYLLVPFILYLFIPINDFNMYRIAKSLIIIVLFIVLEFFIMNKDGLDVTKLFYTFAIGVVVSSVYGLFRGIAPFITQILEVFPYGEFIRFQGLLEHPNVFGILCMVAIAMLSYMLFCKEHKVITVALLGVLTIIGVFTLSKAFLLMVVANYGIMWLIFMKQDWKKGLIILGICIVGAGLFYLVFHDIVNTILLRFVSSFVDQNSGFNLNQITSGRTELWATYMSKWVESPVAILFGYGLGTPDIGDLSVHNMFLAVLYEIGVVGFVLFFGILVYQIVRLLKDDRVSFHLAKLLPIVTVILFSLSEDTLFFLF